MRLHSIAGVALGALALAMTAGCGDDAAMTGAAGRFDAASIDPSRFTGGDLRVDRMGMPAVATATITSKDAYNAANPVDDAAGTFVGEIVANVGGLHAALDDDLTALGLSPCATQICVNQAAPFVVPDVIRIDPSMPAGFPNGRRLTDPVIDVTLALVLLDLSMHPVSALIGVNPTANDLPFRDRFPYVARPHGA
jgi:hypothetical protein